MGITEIQAKSLLRKYKSIDFWFAACGGMNLYRGCAHNCSYCDGRYEKYRVEGEFGHDIQVKVNAPQLLEKELDPHKKRKPLPLGFLFLGGGVNDAYQPAEKEYKLTRQVLRIIKSCSHPVHILTKSTLVERDVDILMEIQEKKPVLVSFSISTADDETARVFEPGASPPSERLALVSRLRKSGIPSGVFLLPLLPLITDTPKVLDRALAAAKKSGAQWAVPGHLTLKEGRQKSYFLERLNKYNPDLARQYEILYPGDPYGNPTAEYQRFFNQVLRSIWKAHALPQAVHPDYLGTAINTNQRIYLILQFLDSAMKQRGYRSPYGKAARALRDLDTPVDRLTVPIRRIPGIGPRIANIIGDILREGTCGLYERFLRE